MRGFTAMLAAALVIGCGGPGPSLLPSATIPATNAASSAEQTIWPTTQPEVSASTDRRAAAWRSDIEQLVTRLEAMHPNFGQQVSVNEFESAARDLSARVPTLTDDELLVGVVGLAASVSRKGCDAHTGAYVWGGGSYPLESLPLRLWLFGDDVYVVDALAPYESLIGQRVLEIGGRAIGEVMKLIEPLVPRDNDETVRLLMPRFLLIPQMLNGVGLEAGPTVELRTQSDKGVATDTVVTPSTMSDYNDWAGPYGLHLPADPAILYLSRMDDRLWFQRLADGALYVQYNQVLTAPLGDLKAQLDDAKVDDVVLDLRNNFGGEVFVMQQMTTLFDDWLAAAPNHRLDVATARNTFSAASLLAARLAAQDRVRVVGEPMGGCPTGWGNSRDFTLTHSAIPISVATTFEIGASQDDERTTIQPDPLMELSFQDWLAKRDPVVAAHDV